MKSNKGKTIHFRYSSVTFGRSKLDLVIFVHALTGMKSPIPAGLVGVEEFWHGPAESEEDGPHRQAYVEGAIKLSDPLKCRLSI